MVAGSILGGKLELHMEPQVGAPIEHTFLVQRLKEAQGFRTGAIKKSTSGLSAIRSKERRFFYLHSF